MELATRSDAGGFSPLHDSDSEPEHGRTEAIAVDEGTILVAEPHSRLKWFYFLSRTVLTSVWIAIGYFVLVTLTASDRSADAASETPQQQANDANTQLAAALSRNLPWLLLALGISLPLNLWKAFAFARAWSCKLTHSHVMKADDESEQSLALAEVSSIHTTQTLCMQPFRLHTVLLARRPRSGRPPLSAGGDGAAGERHGADGAAVGEEPMFFAIEGVADAKQFVAALKNAVLAATAPDAPPMLRGAAGSSGTDVVSLALSALDVQLQKAEALSSRLLRK
eukprot:PLAT14587.1.p1 GENE.PLAT14587.1~~PLAT14587.1.p1  ORF type:complete len:289 (-),score=102.12 PLAT14587.1:59-901(-)